MSTKWHVSLDIRGALNNKSLRGFKHDDGRPMTDQEARDALYDELAKGRRVLPMSPCDNFNYQTGCMGHPVQERPDAASATQTKGK